MTRKEALRYISEKTAAGVPKHIIYKELLPQIPYKEDLLSYMAQVPEADRKIKYNNINRILLTILIYLFIMKVLSIIYFIVSPKILPINSSGRVTLGIVYLLISMFLLYVIINIWRFRQQGYRFVFISIIAIYGVDSHLRGNIKFTLLITIPCVFAFFLSYLILKNVFQANMFRATDKEKLERELIEAGLPKQQT